MKKGFFIKILIVLVVLGALIIIPNTKADIVSGNQYSYTSSFLEEASGATFRVFNSQGLTGSCIDPGVDANTSGTATITKIPLNDATYLKTMKTAYYWGVTRGYLNGSTHTTGIELTYFYRAIQYSIVGEL